MNSATITPIRLVVLISGNGSNLQAIIDDINNNDLPAEIVAVISNKVNAYGLERAKKAGIETQILSHLDYSNRSSYDAALMKTFQITLNRVSRRCILLAMSTQTLRYNAA